MQLTESELAHLHQTATRIRISILEMLANAKSGHSGGALGMADIFTALYFKVAQIEPANPDKPDRDRILLSNGHICPVWYATLAEAGYFSHAELQTLRKLGTRLQGHPLVGSLPGVENTSGPLGIGLSQAVGIALTFKRTKQPQRVFCLMSDGEHQEGQVWEAYMSGAKYNLTNLTTIIDRNNIQIGGSIEDVMPLEPLTAKLASFGWNVVHIDGHNFNEIIDTLSQTHSSQPTAVIAHTIPGKGVSFMEGDYTWHGKPPSAVEAQQAIAALKRGNRGISRSLGL